MRSIPDLRSVRKRERNCVKGKQQEWERRGEEVETRVRKRGRDRHLKKKRERDREKEIKRDREEKREVSSSKIFPFVLQLSSARLISVNVHACTHTFTHSTLHYPETFFFLFWRF